LKSHSEEHYAIGKFSTLSKPTRTFSEEVNNFICFSFEDYILCACWVDGGEDDSFICWHNHVCEVSVGSVEICKFKFEMEKSVGNSHPSTNVSSEQV
jgi:hypothetical protein